jgi:hypothetical protein
VRGDLRNINLALFERQLRINDETPNQDMKPRFQDHRKDYQPDNNKQWEEYAQYADSTKTHRPSFITSKKISADAEHRHFDGWLNLLPSQPRR